MKTEKKFLNKEDLSGEICVVVGTRPGIIMLAPVIHELIKREIPHFIIHTGQHYSPAMDSELFEDLDLPKPAYHLKNVAQRKTHGGQTAEMIVGCEEAFMERQPSLVLVNGDANTNLAAALAARKLRIAIGHIEAGERSFDWRMPEEHNRRIMDHISELLFTTNEKGAEQLKKECVMGEIHITGNTIADASINHAKISKKTSNILETYGLEKEKYILMTSHREENVDDAVKLKNIIEGAIKTSEKLNLPVLFLAHPRTQKRMKEFDLYQYLDNSKNIIVIDALRYLDFINILVSASLVMTDSGGVQQEAYIHKRKTVTLRDSTEWGETLQNGGNRLAGAENSDKIAQIALEGFNASIDDWPEIFGDGNTSKKIIDISVNFLNSNK